ncbi:MAG: hypothetical protein IPO48_09480 [Saprospiraceae bacterium]|nr:hypothetical protein [Saprospiraceae bacterium]
MERRLGYQAKYIANALNPTWVALQDQHPNLPLADLVYVTYIKPTAASGGTAKLPVGTGATAFILNAENISHKVLWKVTDGCGNVDRCESTVMVVDKKAPTPYCVSVSTALMQTNPQMVELWARDFDKGALTTVHHKASCTWNTDYCTVILSVRGGNGSRVSGTVATASGQGVNDVTVEFATNAPEYPKASQTLVNGTFGEIHPNGFNYTVTAAKNSDFLNGVSTLDLVMIQRHILGLHALDSNYKMIAADANKDGKSNSK